MKTPKRIKPLIEDGIVDEVIGQLMSGKEATVYTVRCGSEIRCAKVYKDAAKRSFKKAVQYQEGRKTRNSRRSRAMEKGSKYGRKQQEDVWQNAEVDALYLLARNDVRVPQAYGCFEGVLLMELITDESGSVAPRLNDIVLTQEQAIEDHATMMQYIVRMLCAGVIHGDLSEFNVLVDEYGPVIIDLPQVVNAAANNNAKSMFERDVNNIKTYYAQFAPELKETLYAKEMWALYENAELQPDSILTGRYEIEDVSADVDSVVEEIQAALRDEQARLERLKEREEQE